MKKTISLFSLAFVMLGNTASFSNVVENTSKISSTFEVSNVNPLCLAISKGDIDTVKQIIAYGIDINQTTERGMTPLMFAAIYNNSEIAQLLIKNGADVSKTDKQGKTALDFAKASNATAVIEVLKPSKKKK